VTSPAKFSSADFPIYGSVWWVENKYQQWGKWNPDVKTSPHPVACILDGPTRELQLRPALESVPRTTKGLEHQPGQADVRVTAFDPNKCDSAGTFLCRYRIPIKRSAFDGFAEKRFAGVVTEETKVLLREQVLLANVLDLK
jgi:hypothetical protein